MSGQTIFLIELVLVHGAVLAWACWELWSVRRSQRKDRGDRAQGSGHAEGQHGPDDR